jgi:5-methyltetrahydropteroyltriglutamate--homocysteine methyltransferase
VPKGKTVVLGLVTTKLGDMEDPADVRARIEDAATYMPLDQIALSPQCGFSSTVHGNDIEMDQQSAKLKLVVDVAKDVWGYA